jgi:hypothetical protein
MNEKKGKRRLLSLLLIFAYGVKVPLAVKVYVS